MSPETSRIPTPEEARALLAQASRSESVTKAGSSWPQVAGILSLGATSSLALPAIAYAPAGSLALPIGLMTFWMAASFVFMVAFTRSVKRGFGRRWVLTIVIWGILWVVGILGASTWFAGQTWFLVVACSALTVVTMSSAWIEAKK